MDGDPMTEHPLIPVVLRQFWFTCGCEEGCDRQGYREEALQVLWEEWTRGKAVISLPEPARRANHGTTVWWDPAGIAIAAFPHHGSPRVAMEFGVYSIDWPAEVARDVFTAGLAACTVAEQLPDNAGQQDTGEVPE